MGLRTWLSALLLACGPSSAESKACGLFLNHTNGWTFDLKDAFGGIYVDVDTSSCNFGDGDTPFYFADVVVRPPVIPLSAVNVGLCLLKHDTC
jgi:hypothetical protein